MNKWLLSAVLLLLISGGAWADAAPAKTPTIGGGVPNPWRSPYRIALVDPAGIPPDSQP